MLALMETDSSCPPISSSLSVHPGKAFYHFYWLQPFSPSHLYLTYSVITVLGEKVLISLAPFQVMLTFSLGLDMADLECEAYSHHLLYFLMEYLRWNVTEATYPKHNKNRVRDRYSGRPAMTEIYIYR